MREETATLGTLLTGFTLVDSLETPETLFPVENRSAVRKLQLISRGHSGLFGYKK